MKVECKMKFLNAEELGSLLPQLIKKSDAIYWSVAWATENPIVKLMVSNKQKIKQLVVGVDFAHTSPQTLTTLYNAIACLRLGSSTKAHATFHPKIYAFTSKEKATIVIGSANFTQGGTERNEEASVLIEGNKDDVEIQKIFAQIDNWWRSGEKVDDAFLKAYALRWEKNKALRSQMGSKVKIYVPKKGSSYPKLLEMSWSEYAALVNQLGIQTQRLEGCLAILGKAREFFSTHDSFSEMTLLMRRGIAGVTNENESENNELEGLNWGYLGSMRGLGVFPNVIEKKAKKLDKAFSHIPLYGDVDEDQYKNFFEKFQQSFEKKGRVGGLPSASRLLALLRPDQFICINSGNRAGIAVDLGFAPSTLKLENYWERVIEPIRESNWWNAKNPKNDAGNIWLGRAALLDVLYYERK